jgi:hypothetical protein
MAIGYPPMLVTLEGMVTLVSPVQPTYARPPMLLTGFLGSLGVVVDVLPGSVRHSMFGFGISAFTSVLQGIAANLAFGAFREKVRRKLGSTFGGKPADGHNSLGPHRTIPPTGC